MTRSKSRTRAKLETDTAPETLLTKLLRRAPGADGPDARFWVHLKGHDESQTGDFLETPPVTVEELESGLESGTLNHPQARLKIIKWVGPRKALVSGYGELADSTEWGRCTYTLTLIPPEKAADPEGTRYRIHLRTNIAVGGSVEGPPLTQEELAQGIETGAVGHPQMRLENAEWVGPRTLRVSGFQSHLQWDGSAPHWFPQTFYFDLTPTTVVDAGI